MSDEKYTQVTYSSPVEANYAPVLIVTWTTPQGEEVDVTMEVDRLRGIEALYMDLEVEVSRERSAGRAREVEVSRLARENEDLQHEVWLWRGLSAVAVIAFVLFWIFGR